MSRLFDLVKQRLDEKVVPSNKSLDVKYNDKVKAFKLLMMILSATNENGYIDALLTKSKGQINKKDNPVVEVLKTTLPELKKYLVAVANNKRIPRKSYQKVILKLVDTIIGVKSQEGMKFYNKLKNLPMAQGFQSEVMSEIRKVINYLLDTEEDLTSKDKQLLKLLAKAENEKDDTPHIDADGELKSEPTDPVISKAIDDVKKENPKINEPIQKTLPLDYTTEKEENDIRAKLETLSDEQVQALAIKFNNELKKDETAEAYVQRRMDEIGTILNYDIIETKDYINAKFKDLAKLKGLTPEQEEQLNKFRDLELKLIDETVEKISQLVDNPEAAKKLEKTMSQAIIIGLDSYIKNLPNEELPNVYLEPIINLTPGKMLIGFEAAHDKTNYNMRFEREFTFDGNGKISNVEHSYFEISPKMRKSGIAKEIIRDSLVLYKLAGIDKISLHANIGLGGYVWLRYGFKPDESSIKEMNEQLKNYPKGIAVALNQKTVGLDKYKVLGKLADHFGECKTNKDGELECKNEGLKQVFFDLDKKYQEWLQEVSEYQDKIRYAIERKQLSRVEARKIPNTVSEEVEVKLEPMGDVLAKLLSPIAQTAASVVDFKDPKIYEKIATFPIQTAIDTTFKDCTLADAIKKGIVTLKYYNDLDEVTEKGYKYLNQLLKTDVIGAGASKVKTSKIPVETTVKTLLTVPGLSAEDKYGEEVEITPAHNNRETFVLDWTGSLDLRDPNQFDIAIKYATKNAKKGA